VAFGCCGAEREEKQFFFKKKNQKTFANVVQRAVQKGPTPRRPQQTKVFWFFFSRISQQPELAGNGQVASQRWLVQSRHSFMLLKSARGQHLADVPRGATY
jgi:hypothetical protein